MPDVDAFGKTTVSQCGGERNERSEAIYRTVSRRLPPAENADCMKDRRFVGLPFHFQESPRHSSGKHDEFRGGRYRKAAYTPIERSQTLTNKREREQIEKRTNGRKKNEQLYRVTRILVGASAVSCASFILHPKNIN